ncbi:uncharacterized protein N7496_011275 [Penicillium cataractarum]|uniref:Uncharacterized protein n=1 Tax=Penicillium cataractarum TaxID=2100454 RepID=A0A9W9RF40_9EURO|nr:uncharacterized protein N7496_011275 [Penicillium cataractarum]KAJ5358862.1 hypothetical protein N7496_011275 [Penicillium cataractarum]
MPAVTMTIRAQADSLTSITKRGNWASREPGVILVFCIVFLVGLGIVALFAYRKWMTRKAKKQTFETAA